MNRTLENKTRMTINGYRCRVGNPKHPFYALYKSKGFGAVYEAMGLIESKAIEIKKEVMALYDKHVSGYVYAITNPAWDGWVKIGMAVDIDRRIKQMQTGNHRQLWIMASIPCDSRIEAAELERSFHRFFKKQKIRGEWFNLDKGDLFSVMEPAGDNLALHEKPSFPESEG